MMRITNAAAHQDEPYGYGILGRVGLSAFARWLTTRPDGRPEFRVVKGGRSRRRGTGCWFRDRHYPLVGLTIDA